MTLLSAFRAPFSAFLPARRVRATLLSAALVLVLAACSTANETDRGANQDYADDDASGARPTLPMPAVAPVVVPAAKSKPAVAARRRAAPRPVARVAPKPSPKTIERLAAQPRRQGPGQGQQYSAMVERTATGVRTTQDYSSQSRTKQQRDNAAAVKAYRADKNTRMARAYNNNNLLTR